MLLFSFTLNHILNFISKNKVHPDYPLIQSISDVVGCLESKACYNEAFMGRTTCIGCSYLHQLFLRVPMYRVRLCPLLFVPFTMLLLR